MDELVLWFCLGLAVWILLDKIFGKKRKELTGDLNLRPIKGQVKVSQRKR